MKKLKLNIDNLFSLWDADETKDENLVNWIKNNKDILIDYDNEIIYTGMIHFLEDIDIYGELERQNMLEEGKTIDEINLWFNSISEKQDTIFNSLFSAIAVEKRSRLYIDMILKLENLFYKERSDYLDAKIDLLLDTDSAIQNTKPTKKITAKWHSLLYLLELEASGEKAPINNEGNFIKSEIEKIGNKKTGSSGQSFYRQFLILKDDVKYNHKLVGIFGPDWKDNVIALSNKNKSLILYLDKNY